MGSCIKLNVLHNLLLRTKYILVVQTRGETDSFYFKQV